MAYSLLLVGLDTQAAANDFEVAISMDEAEYLVARWFVGTALASIVVDAALSKLVPCVMR